MMTTIQKIRDRRKERSVFLDRQLVRKKRDWSRKIRAAERILFSAAFVLSGFGLLYGVYLLLFTGATFSIRQVVVEGEWQNLTADGLAAISGVHEGDNLFWTSVSDIREKILVLPWVKSVGVQRRLPATLWISVEEQRPIALLITPEGLNYVNAEGRVFKPVEAGEEREYPVLTGLGESVSDDEPSKRSSRIAEMLLMMKHFRESDLGQKRDVAEIHYDPVEGYSLITMKEPLQILFGKENLPEKIERVARLMSDIASHGGRIRYLLANESGRVIVKYMTNGT